jgi:branched-chain amino acid transport system ATP-binding protein
MPLLELSDVHASYGPIRALHGISLAVEPGQVVAVLGANGAGKSTTLRAISGLVRRRGTIRFDGRVVTRSRPESIARLGIAHVPEGRGLFDALTVEENLRMGVYARKGDVDRVHEYFPWLRERLRQQAATLSGGEQQMLALARALVSKPRLLMLDEPSLGLAPLIVDELFRIVAQLNKEEQLTVLVVEQNAEVALQVADRAYVLETGNVAVEGSADELRAHEGVRKSYLGY